MNRILLAVFIVVLAGLPLLPVTPEFWVTQLNYCLLYTSPSPRD